MKAESVHGSKGQQFKSERSGAAGDLVTYGRVGHERILRQPGERTLII